MVQAAQVGVVEQVGVVDEQDAVVVLAERLVHGAAGRFDRGTEVAQQRGLAVAAGRDDADVRAGAGVGGERGQVRGRGLVEDRRHRASLPRRASSATSYSPST